MCVCLHTCAYTCGRLHSVTLCPVRHLAQQGKGKEVLMLVKKDVPIIDTTGCGAVCYCSRKTGKTGCDKGAKVARGKLPKQPKTGH